MSKRNYKAAKAMLKEAIILGEKGDLDKAADLMMEAAEGQGYNFLLEVGGALEDIRRLGKTQEIYAQAMNMEPDNFQAYLKLGAFYTDLQKYGLAVKNLEKAIELSPGEGALYHNLAVVYQFAGDIDKAVETFEVALKKGCEPYLVYGSLASIYEQSNEMEKLDEVLAAGLKACPNDPYLNFTAAVMERRRDNLDKALEHIETCLNNQAGDLRGLKQGEEDYLVSGNFEKGFIYDKQGDYDKAYKNFAEGNRLAGEMPMLEGSSKEQALANIAEMGKLDYNGWLDQTADPIENQDFTPVFLVGFPRSGTTLLHQVLDGHSGLEVLEEKPLLAVLIEYIERQYGEFPEVLRTLGKTELNKMRDGYMRGLSQLQTKSGEIRLVDKLPMNIIKVPLILKLFPKAKFILALRHPCDCTLSCFMQNFALNNAMKNFQTLEDATHYYDETFALWLKFQREINLDVHMIRYEDVVTDLEKEARGVISFLGLDWQDDVLNYREKAKEKKIINTPSYHQVIKPIYQDAKGRWRRYQTHLDPYLERLAPYIEEFGYNEKNKD